LKGKQNNMAEPGRPEYTDTDYQNWLDTMSPFLKLGATLNAAMDDAGIYAHKNVIYQKYKLGDWFQEKIDALREYPGKLVAYILAKRVIMVNEKIAQGIPVTKDEMDDVKFMADKHRTAQRYFVTRTETAEADPAKVGKILDNMETDYGNVGQEAHKQMVAVDAPVQDKGQAGADSNV